MKFSVFASSLHLSWPFITTDYYLLLSSFLAFLLLFSLIAGSSSPWFLSAVDKEALVAALMQAVEKEDTPQSYAYAFLAASVIPDVDLSALFDSIEDIIAQADETPSTLYVRLRSSK